MSVYVPPQAPPKTSTKSEKTSSTMSSLKSRIPSTWTAISDIMCIVVYIYVAFALLNNPANIHGVVVPIAVLIGGSAILLVLYIDDRETEEKGAEKTFKKAPKNVAPKPKVPLVPNPRKAKSKGKPSWDDGAHEAWSCESWEEFAMEAAHNERAQAQEKAEMNKIKREVDTQLEKKRVAHLYVAVRMLSEVVESLEKAVGRQEERLEEVKKKRMALKEQEVCGDPTLEGDEDDNGGGDESVKSAEDQHEVEHEEYVMVTADADL